MIISLEIPFDPVPWSAPRLGRGGYCYDEREKDKRAIRCCIKQQYQGKPFPGIVTLSFQFFFPVPKSYSKKKRQLALTDKITPTKSDCTNLQKLYEDCLKKIVIEDDRNVSMALSKKMYGEKGRVLITVYCVDERENSSG